MKKGDKVKVVKNVDGYNKTGVIIEINNDIKQNIKVEFDSYIEGVGEYCYYDSNELKLIKQK